MIVAQHQGFGHLAGKRQQLPPEPEIAPLRRLAKALPRNRRDVPLDQQPGFLEQPCVIVVRQIGRHGGGRGLAVKRDQHVDGESIKRRFVGVVLKQPGVGVVAEILDHQEARRDLGGEDPGRAETKGAQMVGDGDIGPDVLQGRRRVHQ